MTRSSPAARGCWGSRRSPTGSREIARRARGTPRIAGRLLRRVVDFALVEGDGRLTREMADRALTRLGVDQLGLDGADRRYLVLIAENYGGGPVGVETLCGRPVRAAGRDRGGDRAVSPAAGPDPAHAARADAGGEGLAHLGLEAPAAPGQAACSTARAEMKGVGMHEREIAALFTRADGDYRFARWGRPIVPVVFGVEPETLSVIKGAIEAVVTLAGHKMAEIDTDLGANLMLFFCRDWVELEGVPNLDRMIPDLGDVVRRLEKAEATQYRLFRYDDAGAIRAGFAFVRMDAEMAALPAEVLALDLSVRMILDWSETAFAQGAPLAEAAGRVVLRPDVAGVIRAGYDPVLPGAATDNAHALRLAARV